MPMRKTKKTTVTNLKKPTLTVGIPAYNEEKNIEKLVVAMFDQSAQNYTLEKVFVVSDGSVDQTNEIVQKLQKRYPKLKLSASSARTGKAPALNKIYDTTTSDYLLTIDADVLPTKKNFLDVLIASIEKYPDAVVVGSRHVPAHTKTFWGKCAEVSYLSLEDAFLKFKHGNNMYAIMSAYLIRKSHYQSLRYPKGTMADQCYLYASAVAKHPEGFHLELKAGVWFAPVDTFMDWRLLGLRSVSGDRNDVQKYFGKQIIEANQLPKELYYQSLLRWLIKRPIHSVGSILLNLYIRKFPLQKKTPKNGMWESSQSSKSLIV